MFHAAQTPVDSRGTIVVTLMGDAGMAACDAVEQAMLPVTAAHPHIVIFDLSRVTFMCSLTLGSLVSVHRSVIARGGRCIVAGASPDIDAVIRRCKLDAIFDLKPSVESAQAAAG